MTATLVAPGPRATTDPSPSTIATRASSVVQMGWAPTSTLPLLSVIVAARCSVSPTASAVSAAGLTPTHAAPMLPMVWCASERPITPYVYNADTSDTTAAPVDATAATVRHACVNRAVPAASRCEEAIPTSDSVSMTAVTRRGER